jgi:hypothetical protein
VLTALAGAILVNGVPHFVNGMLGNPFPTLFADPPLAGLSRAVVNAVWGLVNFAGGYALLAFTRSRTHRAFWFAATVFAGAILFALYFSTAVEARLGPILRATGN